MLVQCSKLHKFCIFFYLNDYYSHTAHSARLAPSPFLSPLFFTHPHSHPPPPVLMPAPSCLTLGFLAFSWRWSNPSELYWTSHSIQTSFLLFFFFFLNLLVIQFSILLRLHPVHSQSAGKIGDDGARVSGFGPKKKNPFAEILIFLSSGSWTLTTALQEIVECCLQLILKQLLLAFCISLAGRSSPCLKRMNLSPRC